MKFTAVGDVLCQRRMPETYEGFEEICDFIAKGDVRFFNLETTVNYEGECYGCQHSGGTYVRCAPEVMQDMLRFGFNSTTFNNNHAMDFAHEGMLRTMEYVNETGIVHAGVGMNLHQAAAPAYIETPNGRVALIAVSTSFNAAMMAGAQSRRIPGRPGVNGISVSRKLRVPHDAFEVVKMIGDKSGINDSKNITRKEGYAAPLPEGTAEIGEQLFVEGDDYGVIMTAAKKDIERVHASIREASLQADYVLISIHAHQILSSEKNETPEFLQELCRGFVDAGADAVVGHGPHLLRAIEVYNKKPIFYSLGDFVIQLYQLPIAPEDFYEKYGLDSNSSVIELLRKRSANFTRGLMEEDRMRETVIPYWETDEEKNLTKLYLKPVKSSLREGKHLEGLPQPVEGDSFMKTLAEISKPFGTTIEKEGDLWVCRW